MQLPISMKVEQTPQGEAKSQLGFIQFLVRPMFDEFSSFWQSALAKSSEPANGNKVVMLGKIGRTQSTGTIHRVSDVDVSCAVRSERRVSEAPVVVVQQKQASADFTRDMAANIEVALEFWEKQAKGDKDGKKTEDEDDKKAQENLGNTDQDEDADKDEQEDK